jgi:hypothetical protein
MSVFFILDYILTFSGSGFRKGYKDMLRFEADDEGPGELTYMSGGSVLLLESSATTGGADPSGTKASKNLYSSSLKINLLKG